MKRRQQLARIIGLIGAATVIITGFLPPVRQMVNLPKTIMVPSGQHISLPWSTWLSLGSPKAYPVFVEPGRVDIWGANPGHFVLQPKLFGWIPWRPVPVDVTKPLYEVPGGQSIGVVVNTRGLVVRGYAPIVVNGHLVDPAEEAGIDKGDVIVEANHHLVTSNQALEQAVQRSGKRHQAVALGVQGARHFHWRYVRPVWSQTQHAWHIGVVVQGGASGVGTLTFYDPHTLKYAALGHSITDGLTRIPISVRSGQLTGARIVGIIAGSIHGPGQKIGVLANGHNVQGNVVSNGLFGITGILSHKPLWGPKKALPVALPDQVHPGPAQIITVLHGQSPQLFSIRILKTYLQWHAHTKGLLFEVDDPALLRQTGGIIQGMSGSPIIQDGHLVGAVTHVLMSRPSLGYGCYAYWMVKQKSFS
ncbi:stage IV sporulation protein B [Sulfobacillus thermosulfidooxidans DSM 9293]|uniref:Stage IV sporulation protein B n=2 Tax=Sulfobacillus thermosulfidooxidans TaxID=28034 RepID=A0A1W1WIR7_SULTA|nr:SpoIVB peptidase [Sulfobacillus thermosulfidooxidans]PSR29206.1 MAG: SpoIVB peptidase [Sulfobacillus thermosulfidooxidans]SMC06208.1 stage IV sporulation protein B [Sulfobacillus thermosulfidooxidans DSM 9293]